jgi:hypothetical protein
MKKYKSETGIFPKENGRESVRTWKKRRRRFGVPEYAVIL